MPAPCPGSYEPPRIPGLWPGASPLVPPGALTTRGSVVWFIRTVQKEIGRVSPMRVRPCSMLGKGYRAGSTAASVIGWAGVVPLGISHDLRRVGGLCALNGTSVGGRLAPSRSGSRAQVDS